MKELKSLKACVDNPTRVGILAVRSTKKTNLIQTIQSTSQLAKHLNLSRWTVSRVLNGHAGVHPDTVQKVRSAIEELGFSPNHLAQGLRKGRTDTVGVCVPDIESFYLSHKLEALRISLLKNGLKMVVAMTHSDPATEVETLNYFRASQAGALITFASRLAPSHPAVKKYEEAGIPLISVDPLTDFDGEGLRVDRGTGTTEAMKYLYALGHRSFATLGISGVSSYSQRRREAIHDFFRANRLKEEESITHLSLEDNEGDDLYALGFQSAQRVASALTRKGKVTALLTVNDRLAVGLIAGLRSLGVSVPDDLSIVGYDNIGPSPYILPPLTTIDPRPDELMTVATESLFNALQGGLSSPAACHIASRLVIRGSTQARKA